MKTVLLIIALVANFALGGDSLAATHGNAGGESLQPTPPSKLAIDTSEFAGKENLEILLQKLNDPLLGWRLSRHWEKYRKCNLLSQCATVSMMKTFM